MAEYIEKDKAKELVCEFCTWVGTSNCEECEHPVDDVPAADVQPVRHGRWVEDSDPGQEIGTAWRCSSCGITIGMKKVEKDWHHYCPNCGAKMDKEEE